MPLLAFLVVALELVEALLSLEILRRTGRGKDFVAGYLDGSVGWFLWCLEDLEAKRIFFWRLDGFNTYLEHLFDSRTILSN